MRGAPIRFVVAVVGGWACVRIAVLLPGESPLDLAADVLAPPAMAAGRSEPLAVPAGLPSAIIDHPPASAVLVSRAGRRQGATATSARIARAAEPAPAVQVATTDVQPTLIVPVTGLPPSQRRASRLGVSAWLLARGGANGTLSGGMLGASQAGARVTYAIDRGRRVTFSARVAAPLQGRGAEAAVGVDWQPTRAPVHLLAEQRFGLDGARGGPTVMVIAGLNPTPVVAGFRLEAYAQGGAIWRGGRAEAFGDGAARLTHPVASAGGITLDAGAGGWAAGQRGAARVDIGPTVGLALPIAKRRVRVSLDWRQRVAGRARPGSGLALSIGTDF